MQTTVKTLFEKGYSKTQIAKMLEIDRKTVKPLTLYLTTMEISKK